MEYAKRVQEIKSKKLKIASNERKLEKDVFDANFDR